MVLEEIIMKIPQLTTRERLLLLEKLSRSLITDFETRDTHGSAERLLGIIPNAGDLTDEEIERIRFEQILEKHS
jgi:hypothetical protein